MTIRITSVVAFAFALLASAAVHAVELPGPLVSPQWLAQHRAEVNIVDVREDLASFTKAPVFATEDGKKSLSAFGGHIPGAVALDFAKVRAPRQIDGREIKWMLPERAAFQQLMREIGVKAGRPTVIVANGEAGGDLDMAARVYWSMKVYGDDRLAILNGGTAGWLQQGLPFSTDAAGAGNGDWSATAPRTRYVASSDDVAKAIGTAVQLVDARPLPFYVGLARKPIVAQAGHLEGAVDFPPDVRSTKIDGGEGFLDAAQYQSIFKHVGIDASKPSITYCNTGHLASGAWFVLSEVMKNPDVRLYDGSMYEWTTEQRPVVGLLP